MTVITAGALFTSLQAQASSYTVKNFLDLSRMWLTGEGDLPGREE